MNLLQPRYKVIADYPQVHIKDDDLEHRLIMGDILTYLKVNDSMTFRRTGRCGYMSVRVPCINNPEKYPSIFKKLEWYEDREEKDMPEYVRNPIEVMKVRKYDIKGDRVLIQFKEGGSSTVSLKHLFLVCTPATEEEFKNQAIRYDTSK